ncbi:MAG: aegerolysin family protein, partial [Kluyvera sp.]
SIDCGKFYKQGNKGQELSKNDINNLVINRTTTSDEASICSCGRSDAAMGTEGSFVLYDGAEKIGRFYWDCPWGKKTNKKEFTSASDKYIVQTEGGNVDSGALGNITLKIAKI